MDKWEDKASWFNLSMLFIFNAFDTLGRKIGGMIMIPKNMIILLSLARVAFWPTTFIIGYKFAHHPED